MDKEEQLDRIIALKWQYVDLTLKQIANLELKLLALQISKGIRNADDIKTP